jgi:hypothetical protein
MPWRRVGNGCIDPHFLDLGTSWRWVVSFTPRPLYPLERASGTHCIGGWVDPRGGLDSMEKWNFFTLPGFELRPLGRPARSQSLYRLRYPVSIVISIIIICFFPPVLVLILWLTFDVLSSNITKSRIEFNLKFLAFFVCLLYFECAIYNDFIACPYLL